jgi:aminoglycoside N3'-acetyltransferase
VEPQHFRIMMTCAEICQAAANVMLIGTRNHRHTCRECAEVCAECAESCARVGSMEDCVQACRRCAESCRRMAA